MLNTNVLVLNRLYQPVHVTSVKRAFSLLYQGVARAIDQQYKLYEFADWAQLSAAEHESVSTINRRIRVPRVVGGAGETAIPASTAARSWPEAS
jgi:hypothetical protein